MSRRALVTGATRGIGKAVAIRLIEDGWEVVGTGRQGAAQQMASDPKLAKAQWLDLDFANPISRNQFFLNIREKGPFQGLVNNAGVNRIKPITDVDENDFEYVHDVNLKGPYLLCREIVQEMAANNGGRIVNIASIWSVISKANRSLYSSSKTGLIGLTRALAIEAAKDHVLVNAVSPGFVMTDMTRDSLSTEQIDQLTKEIPLGRMAEPTEITEIVLFLLSEKNQFITGQNIVVDGGFSIT
mgnify:CR=1 FL=1